MPLADQVSTKWACAVVPLQRPYPRTTVACAQTTALTEDNSQTYLRLIQMQDFALVKKQTVRLEPGLNIVTGESGAGKSVLVCLAVLQCTTLRAFDIDWKSLNSQ